MTQKFPICRRTPTARRRRQQQQQQREGGGGEGRRSARAFVFVLFFLLACECSSGSHDYDSYSYSTGGYETEEDRSFAVKSYYNGAVAVVSPTEILIDASVVRVPSDVHVAALKDDALDLTGDIGYDLDTVETKLTQLRETLTNVKLLAAKNVAGNVQCNLEGTKEVRFDFESKSFDTTHCVCKDKFVGDLCETAVDGILSGDREEFVAAVTKCLEVDPVHGNCPDSEYGVMSEWDVSLVKDFSYAFSGQTTFNADISAWDTRSAESFERTFNECGTFNQDLSKWNTASVTSIKGMFSAASAFDSDLSGWVTSKITDMSYAFSMAHSFKGVGLSGWDTSEVVTLESTFNGATVFDEDISKWSTTKVTSMMMTFGTDSGSSVAFNQPIGTWDTSSVTTMVNMFYANENFNQSLKWNTSLVQNMANMFTIASAFNGELITDKALGYWDTSLVQNFRSMFYGSSFNQDISGWDTSSATDMSFMFSNLENFNQDLSNWNVSKVSSFRRTFYDCQKLDTDLSRWDVSSVTTFEQTFQRAYLFDSDLSQWNTAAVTNMNGMFHSAKKFNHPIGSWDVSKVSNMRYMFYAATAYKQDLRGWNLASISTTNIVTGYLYLIFSGATKMSAYWKCDATAGLKTADISSCSPQLLLPKTDYHAKLQECQKTCKAQNHCCNLDVSVGSNQYNSCLQSCAGRLSGQTQATCEAGCVKSCNGGLTVEGETFSKCSTCSDIGGETTTSGTCSAQYASDEKTCKAGCAIAPDLGKYWRIRLLEQEGAWNVKEIQFFTGQGNTEYYDPTETTKTSAWAGGSLHDKTKCIQSSNYGGHGCDRAFDNDVASWWSNWASSYPATESSPWIGMSFDEAVTVSHVRFLNGRAYPEGKTAVIEHAMDLDGEWTEWSGSRIITEAKIQTDSAGENTWQEAVAETQIEIENFKYVGEGECRQEDGEYGISFQTYYAQFEPHTEGSNAANSLTDCAAKCESFSWCLGFNLGLRDDYLYPFCALITDWQAYVVEAGQTFQENQWGGNQTINGVYYQTYCWTYATSSDKCTEANVHGNGYLYPREGYHCYARTGFSS